jgi:hypothetical protein
VVKQQQVILKEQSKMLFNGLLILAFLWKVVPESL